MRSLIGPVEQLMVSVGTRQHLMDIVHNCIPGEPKGMIRLAFSNLSRDELGTFGPATEGPGTGALDGGNVVAMGTGAGFACIFWYAARDTAPKAAPPTSKPSFSVK